MLPLIAADKDAKGVSRASRLACRGPEQPRDKFNFASRLLEGWIGQERALVDEADELAQGADMVGETALVGGPDGEEGEGVDEDKDDECIVRR